MGIVVLVSGGRFYTNGTHVAAWLDYINDVVGIKSVVHGGATGVDTFADIWCVKREIECFAEKPDYNEHRPNIAPLIRNSTMLEKYPIDLGLVMPGGNGTADMRKKLIKAGIEYIHVNHLTWPPIDQHSS